MVAFYKHHTLPYFFITFYFWPLGVIDPRWIARMGVILWRTLGGKKAWKKQRKN